jgi:hypothetical protein
MRYVCAQYDRKQDASPISIKVLSIYFAKKNILLTAYCAKILLWED